MELEAVPFRSPLSAYERQAEALLAGHKSGDAGAIQIFHQKHPRFLDEVVKWKPKPVSEAEIRDTALTLEDAQLAVARSYDFLDWTSLVTYVDAVARDGPVFRFESAVEDVVHGDLAALEDALRWDPELVRARSARVCPFDPLVHRCTLLHYVAANGVEGYRQKAPANGVAIARTLLEAGAEVDSLADLYSGNWTTMGLLVSSCHPAEAGTQVNLVHLLLDYGADIESPSTSQWGSPVRIALSFGMRDAALALAGRGASIDLPTAAGLGLLEAARRLLPMADAEGRQRALGLAAQNGNDEIVRLLLDAGEDPNRYNLPGNHAHSTPLHQAVLGGHEAVIRLLVSRGARLDLRDTIWKGTPLGWARYGGGKAQAEMAELLRSLGALE